MSTSLNTAGIMVRRAGHSTRVLQVFSTFLLVVLGFLYMDMSHRQASLQEGIRENSLWSVYQLDREARALEASVEVYDAAGDTSPDALRALSTRYDILYSRVGLLRNSSFQHMIEADQTILKATDRINRLVMALEPVFDTVVKYNMLGKAGLARMHETLDRVTDESQNLLMYANASISTQRADNRETIRQLEQTSAVFLVLLVASVLFLIVSLHNQVKSVRDAGLNLETMASEMEDAYQAADAGNRAKSQFMATIGHEIRTPLNAILGMAELMELGDLRDEEKRNIRTIRSSGEALLEILSEILDYSKIEHGKLELENRVVDIEDLLQTTTKIISGRAADHGNAIVLDIPDQLLAPVVRTDPTRLRQVVLNLMSNAVKFTNKGTVTLRARQSESEGKLWLRIEVQDTGIGIDAAGKLRLFQPFSQVDASISRKYGGTGLGLTICKEIIERLGGEIGVDSMPGSGSTFWLQIPVEPTTQKPGKVADTAQTATHALPRMRILLVEDNHVNQQVASRFLEKLGQTVFIANHGQEAVTMTQDQAYDLILMDMQMPVMDGIEATRQIIARGGPDFKTPIVAMTANASDDDRERCAQAGMCGFELKPITMKRLHDMLERVSGTLKPDHGKLVEPTAEVIAFPQETDTLPRGLNAERKAELVEALGEDTFTELLNSFFADAAELLDDVHHAATVRDAKALDAALHTIKGAAANVGMDQIADLAQHLRGGDSDEANLNILTSMIMNQKTELAA